MEVEDFFLRSAGWSGPMAEDLLAY
jgi:hypothetical protein